MADAVGEMVRAIYQRGELAGFAELLAEDVQWSDADGLRSYEGRDEVLTRFRRWIGRRPKTTVSGVEVGADGVLCKLRADRPDPTSASRALNFWHVLIVRGGFVTEIRRYGDRAAARRAIGLP